MIQGLFENGNRSVGSLTDGQGCSSLNLLSKSYELSRMELESDGFDANQGKLLYVFIPSSVPDGAFKEPPSGTTALGFTDNAMHGLRTDWKNATFCCNSSAICSLSY
jgi:hypothetical protein